MTVSREDTQARLGKRSVGTLQHVPSQSDTLFVRDEEAHCRLPLTPESLARAGLPAFVADEAAE